MKLVGHHYPGLIVSETARLESEDDGNLTTEQEGLRAPRSTPRGLAVYIEPDTTWEVERGSPWTRVDISPHRLAALSSMAFVGGTAIEANVIAHKASAYAGRIKKTKPILFRRLYAQTLALDADELVTAGEEFHGFLVPAYQSSDMALAYERTRRRIVRLIDRALESGWTQSPRIAVESPSPEFSERITADLVDVIVPDDAPPHARFNAPKIAVPLRKGEMPWWITSENYFYCLRDNKLFWSNWMVDPLTHMANSE